MTSIYSQSTLPDTPPTPCLPHRSNPVGRWRFALTLFLTLFAATATFAADGAPEALHEPEHILQLAAERHGLDSAGLELVDQHVRTLRMSPSSLTRAKIFDSTTNKVHFVDLDENGNAVDGAAWIAEDRAAYQATFGALHPDLRATVDELDEEESLAIGLWLRADAIVPFERPDPFGEAGSEMTPEQAKELKSQASSLLASQMPAIQSSTLEALGAHEITPSYVSPIAPLVYVTAPKSVILELAFHPDVDTIYGPNENRDYLDVVKLAHKADVVDSWNFEGSGIEVGILEDSRIEFTNPNLPSGTTRVSGDPNVDDHATACAGIVASQASSAPGVAQNATLVSANATSYSSSDIAAAIDWAASTQTVNVINNSWGGNEGSTDLNDHDRHFDYVVRYVWPTVTTASGNNYGTCGTGTGNVGSPGKAYNGITVGGIDDQGTETWDDDTMYTCTSSINPSTGAEKPEVVASARYITSTLASSPWIAGAGSGTSYAAPVVAGLAADILSADGSLLLLPEAVKAIILATALHNVIGNEHHSNRDGTGCVDFRAGVYAASKDHWDWRNCSASTFPYERTHYCDEGQRVRAVICWDSNPNSSYTTDPLEADIDLRAYSPSGALVETSLSSVDPFEIVEFVATESGTYTFEIDAATFGGSVEYVGFACFASSIKLEADEPQIFTGPGHPSDQLVFNPQPGWNVIALQTYGSSNYDLNLWEGSPWRDPADRELLTTSNLSGQTLDLVLVDRNHAIIGSRYPRARMNSGNEARLVEFAKRRATLGEGSYGPYTLEAEALVEMFDYEHSPGLEKHVRVVPLGGDVDLGLFMFSSNSGDSSTWYQKRSDNILSENSRGPGETESFSYVDSAGADRFGLVVTNMNAETANSSSDFHIFVDTTAATGTVTINEGATQTGAARVRVQVELEDLETGVQRVRYREAGLGTWIDWYEVNVGDPSFTDSFEISLSPGPGLKTVEVQVRNSAGMIEVFSDTIGRYACPQPAGPLTNGFFGDTTGFPWCFEDEGTDGLASFSQAHAAVRGSNDGSGTQTRSYIHQLVDLPAGDHELRFTWTFTILGLLGGGDAAYWDLVDTGTGTSVVGGPAFLSDVDGSAGGVAEVFSGPGVFEVRLGVRSNNLGVTGLSRFDNVRIDAVAIPEAFSRGDCNVDGDFQIADVVFLLAALFDSGPQPCADACDANDDGAVQISDVVFMTEYLFASGTAPAPPFPSCGADPTADALDCLMNPACP